MNVAFIPVRGGSKSIPKKNIKELLGVPLLCYTLEAVETSTCIDLTVIATDDDEIAQVARDYSLPNSIIYHRDPINAKDDSTTESVMLEFFSKVDFFRPEDMIFLLQVTSPLTTGQMLDRAYSMMMYSGKTSCLSAVLFKRFLWSLSGTPIGHDPRFRSRRQDTRGFYLENGAFYCNTAKNLIETGCRVSEEPMVYVMPPYTMIELDEPEDWMEIQRIILENRELYERRDSIAEYLGTVYPNQDRRC